MTDPNQPAHLTPLPIETPRAERWYDWTWDCVRCHHIPDVFPLGTIQYQHITRWRRGWLTFYRLETTATIEWWVYLPFNIGLGFGHDI